MKNMLQEIHLKLKYRIAWETNPAPPCRWADTWSRSHPCTRHQTSARDQIEVPGPQVLGPPGHHLPHQAYGGVLWLGSASRSIDGQAGWGPPTWLSLGPWDATLWLGLSPSPGTGLQGCPGIASLLLCPLQQELACQSAAVLSVALAPN